VVTNPSHHCHGTLTQARVLSGARIGLVSDIYTPQVNGVTTVVQRIVALLGAEGHDTAVVAPRYPGSGGPGTDRDLWLRSVAFPFHPDIRLSLPNFGAMRGAWAS
jgi:hypothetical protein